MSKETEYSLSVTVKDGPKMLPQKTKLPLSFKGTNVKRASNEDIELTLKPKKKIVDSAVFPLRSGEWLEFITIHADKYTFKDHCGKEHPGIAYRDVSDPDPKKHGPRIWLDGPHVYINRALQPLGGITELEFWVCDDMLECEKDEEKQKVVVSVTHGTGVANDKDSPACCLPVGPGKGQAGPKGPDPTPAQRDPMQNNYPPPPVSADSP